MSWIHLFLTPSSEGRKFVEGYELKGSFLLSFRSPEVLTIRTTTVDHSVII
ncbi:Hypothetical protein FKW44_009200, partial [Caligus rogercresseyi]